MDKWNAVDQCKTWKSSFCLCGQVWGTSQDAEELLRQAVIFPVDTQTLSGGNIEISQEIQTE